MPRHPGPVDPCSAAASAAASFVQKLTRPFRDRKRLRGNHFPIGRMLSASITILPAPPECRAAPK